MENTDILLPQFCSKRECPAFHQTSLEELVSKYTKEKPGHCEALEDTPVEMGEPCLASETEFRSWLLLQNLAQQS